MPESSQIPHSVCRKRTFHTPTKCLSSALLMGVVALFAGSSAAQTAPAQTAPPPPSQTAPPSAAEHKISPEQAPELFRSVDEILKFTSTETAPPDPEKV